MDRGTGFFSCVLRVDSVHAWWFRHALWGTVSSCASRSVRQEGEEGAESLLFYSSGAAALPASETWALISQTNISMLGEG